MTSIQPNAFHAAPQAQASQPAGQATAGGAQLPANRQQHVENQLNRAVDVLQRSVNQGRISPQDARTYFSGLEQRGESWAAETVGQSLDPVVAHAFNQIERGRDILNRSIGQGRIDPVGARELFSRIEDRVMNFVESRS